MNKTILLCTYLLTLPLPSLAMEGMAEKEAQENYFDLIGNDLIKEIASHLDAKSRDMLRLTGRRFDAAAWPFEKAFKVAMIKKSDESEGKYWQRVLDELDVLSQRIQQMQGHNDIKLRLSNSEALLSFPIELSHVKELNGLAMVYSLDNCLLDSYLDVQLSNLEKLPMVFPNLKLLTLPFGHCKEHLPSTLKKLMRLQSLYALHYKLNSEDFSRIPPSVTTLSLIECCISDIPQSIAELISLRLLNLSKNEELNEVELEKLSPLAHSLEKLSFRQIGLANLPHCLASFEKLQELDISQNELSPEALNCLTKLQNLRWINLSGNEACEAQIELMRSMFPATVTISLNIDDMIF